MIINLEDQKQYHSFILCRINSLELAQKCKNIVISKDNLIPKIDQIIEKKDYCEKEYSFNISLNAVKYKYGEVKLILAQVNNILKLFNEAQRMCLQKFNYLYFNALQFERHVQFYLYLNRNEFVQIRPLLIVKNVLVYRISEIQYKDFEKEAFKVLKKAETYSIDKFHFQRHFFHFSSDFSLLSDEHFLNVLVSGYSNISAYARINNLFIHRIDEQIYSSINQFFPTPKL